MQSTTAALQQAAGPCYQPFIGLDSSDEFLSFHSIIWKGIQCTVHAPYSKPIMILGLEIYTLRTVDTGTPGPRTSLDLDSDFMI